MKKTILVLGASGMLGSAVLKYFHQRADHSVFASVRSFSSANGLPEELRAHVVDGVDVQNQDQLVRLFSQIRPEVVINCVGVVKQLAHAEDPLVAIPINALVPHRIADLCRLAKARLIHVSTDCVFSGTKSMYREDEAADALDLYGRSKLLGEVDYPHAITLRTSIIGHELSSKHSLIEWFLNQAGSVNGYTRAIFSGLPTFELARVMHDFVLPTADLHGVYHVSSDPISKFDLLTLVARLYEKRTKIMPSDAVVIDRSLDSSRFRQATGYAPPRWPELIRNMRAFHQRSI